MRRLGAAARSREESGPAGPVQYQFTAMKSTHLQPRWISGRREQSQWEAENLQLGCPPPSAEPEPPLFNRRMNQPNAGHTGARGTVRPLGEIEQF